MSSGHPKSPSLPRPNPERPGPDHTGPARRRPRIRPAARKKAAPDLLDAACRLHDRALTWRDQGHCVRAAAAARRALALAERAVSPDHPDVANILINLAGIAEAQGDYALAERAVAIMAQIAGNDEVAQLRIQAVSRLA